MSRLTHCWFRDIRNNPETFDSHEEAAVFRARDEEPEVAIRALAETVGRLAELMVQHGFDPEMVARAFDCVPTKKEV